MAGKIGNSGQPVGRVLLSRIERNRNGDHKSAGPAFGDNKLLTDLAVTLVCNDYGSEVIGDAIGPFFQEAVLREGYRPLPPQEKPVVMNVKGASASGKSTMRPLQQVLAKKLNFPWEEFALISPDIWRKFLLDYGSLVLLRHKFLRGMFLCIGVA